MRRNEPCFCGSGRKHKKCHPDIHPESRAANLMDIYREIDQRVQDYQEQTQIKPPCFKGCSECCYHHFSVSQVEFELLMHEIRSKWSQEEIDELFDRGFECLETLKEEDPDLYETLEGLAGPEDRDLIDKQRVQMLNRSENRFPCPFLDTTTGACKVYDVRPFACRTHGVTHIDKVNNVPIPVEDVEVCSKISSFKENVEVTPDVSDLGDSHFLTINPYDETTDTRIDIRQYPIYYWLKVLYNKKGQRKEAGYIHGRENFSRSMDQDNKEMVRMFMHR